jgi:hypothetical protein
MFCTLYGPISSLLPLQPSFPSLALSLSTAFCPLYCPLPHLQPFVLSTVLCLLYSPFPLYDPLSPLRPSVLAMPDVSSTALCPLYGPLFPLQSSVPSADQTSEKQRNKRNDTYCFMKCFAKHILSKV